MTSVLVAWFAQVWFGEPTANHVVPAFFRSRSCQNRRPALCGLGKTIGNPFMMAISPRKSRNHAKTRDCGRLGKNRSGTRLSWPSRLFPMALMPKPATGLGKFRWEPVYHGDFPRKKRRLRQNRRSSTRLGKFEAEPVYHGDRETRRIGETISISEIIWVGKTVRVCPARNSEPPSFLPDFQWNAV